MKGLPDTHSMRIPFRPGHTGSLCAVQRGGGKHSTQGEMGERGGGTRQGLNASHVKLMRTNLQKLEACFPFSSSLMLLLCFPLADLFLWLFFVCRCCFCCCFPLKICPSPRSELQLGANGENKTGLCVRNRNVLFCSCQTLTGRGNKSSLLTVDSKLYMSQLHTDCVDLFSVQTALQPSTVRRIPPFVWEIWLLQQASCHLVRD